VISALKSGLVAWHTALAEYFHFIQLQPGTFPPASPVVVCESSHCAEANRSLNWHIVQLACRFRDATRPLDNIPSGKWPLRTKVSALPFPDQPKFATAGCWAMAHYFSECYCRTIGCSRETMPVTWPFASKDLDIYFQVIFQDNSVDNWLRQSNSKKGRYVGN